MPDANPVRLLSRPRARPEPENNPGRQTVIDETVATSDHRNVSFPSGGIKRRSPRVTSWLGHETLILAHIYPQICGLDLGHQGHLWSFRRASYCDTVLSVI